MNDISHIGSSGSIYRTTVVKGGSSGTYTITGTATTLNLAQVFPDSRPWRVPAGSNLIATIDTFGLYDEAQAATFDFQTGAYVDGSLSDTDAEWTSLFQTTWETAAALGPLGSPWHHTFLGLSVPQRIDDIRLRVRLSAGSPTSPIEIILNQTVIQLQIISNSVLLAV